jgi:predicted enzyme related to lactoylglutathione lyase
MMKRIVILLAAGLIILSASLARAADDPSAARPAPAKNPVVHWELACHDSEKSATFFKNLFEWEIAMVPDTIIHGWRTGAEDGGIDGGLLHTEPHEIFPGIWICLFNDPSGVTFAMLEHRPAEK